MASLLVPLPSDTYEALLDHYLKSKQFSVAMDLLLAKPGSVIGFNRFLHHCTQNGEMELAEKAFSLMSQKGCSVTLPIINMLIRGHGSRGHLDDSFSLFRDIEDKYGLRPDSDSYIALLDASMAAGDLDKSMWAFEKIDQEGQKVTLNRTRRLVRALCLERRKEDAFAVFNIAVSRDIPCDAAVCSDLIDLLHQCHGLESSVDIYNCMKKRGIRVDIMRSHALITQLSQIDELDAALETLSSIPLNAHRAVDQTYSQLIGACFRKGMSDKCMELISEYLSVSPADKKPDALFFHMCLQGFKAMKCPLHAINVWNLMERHEIKPDFGCYKQYICATLNAHMLKQALATFDEMQRSGENEGGVTDFEISNAYIRGLSASKQQVHHKLAWDMFRIQTGAGVELQAETYEALFDSCVLHARTSRIVEVGLIMDEARVGLTKVGSPKSVKRYEQLRRARNVLSINDSAAISPKKVHLRSGGQSPLLLPTHSGSASGSSSPAASHRKIQPFE